MSILQLLLASTALTPPPSTFSVEYLVVGGGGGGGGNFYAGAGGGGGGGVLAGALGISLATNYTVTVGTGGTAGPNAVGGVGGKGGNSVFSSLTSIGGGGGSSQIAPTSGGSGGGGCGRNPANPPNQPAGAWLGAAGTSGQGFAGGDGDQTKLNTSAGGGGGGGASAVGENAPTTRGGNGGQGQSSSITGTTQIYGSGGGGSTSGGIQGTGGTNAGTWGVALPVANRGGGGSGNGSWGGGSGQAGGSGVVILRYPNTLTLTNPGGGLTFTTAAVGGDTVATFTAGTGNVQWNPTIVTSGLVMNLDAGNVASYPGTGTTWTDLSGNGNNLTATNSPTWNSSGWFATGATGHFTRATGIATGHFTRATGIAMPQGNDPYTMQAWVRRASWVGTFRGIVAIGNTSGPNNTNNVLASYGNIGNLTHYWWGNDLNAPNNTGSISLNTWFMVTANFDGTTRRIYTNTTQVASDTPGSGHNVNSSAITLCKTDIGDMFWNADIAIARIYNRALSASEVTQNFNANKARFGL